MRIFKSMLTIFLHSTLKQFTYYKTLGDRTFEQLNEEQLFWEPQPSTNSIAIIVQHLSGNMKSRWTHFLHADGEKEWRNRDQEFELYLKTKDQVSACWEEGWQCLFDSLALLNEENIHTLFTSEIKNIIL